MLNRSNIMKKLSIPSAIVGLVFGLIATVFMYLFVPPPSTASADDCDCPSRYDIKRIVLNNCMQSSDSVYAYNCASNSTVKSIVRRYCS